MREPLLGGSLFFEIAKCFLANMRKIAKCLLNAPFGDVQDANEMRTVEDVCKLQKQHMLRVSYADVRPFKP